MEQDESFKVGQALPLKTTDAILANCLRIAGVPELPHSPWNIYTDDILFAAGGGKKDDKGNVIRRSRFSGMSTIEAAQEAWKLRTKGKVEYYFEHTKELAHFVNAYRDQEAKIKAEGSDKDAGEAIREIMHVAAEGDESGVKMDEREALLRILCVALKLRIGYVNRWKESVPMLLVINEGKTQTGTGPLGGKLETYSGGKLVPLNASEELLRKMGLI